ncbi:MAG: hypothetical protein ACKO7W_16105 [Elainella sp.]
MSSHPAPQQIQQQIQQQVQELIQTAPTYGIPAKTMQQIAPLFAALASKLRHLQYFIVQSLEHSWLTTTLQHGTSDLTKTVIYAYPSLEVAKVRESSESQGVALPVPTVAILFQLLALPVDSLIFVESADAQTQTEISRSGLNQMLEQYLRSLISLPSDIA